MSLTKQNNAARWELNGSITGKVAMNYCSVKFIYNGVLAIDLEAIGYVEKCPVFLNPIKPVM